MNYIAVNKEDRITAYSITDDIALSPGERLELVTLRKSKFPDEIQFCKFVDGEVVVDKDYKLSILKKQKIKEVKEEAARRLSPDDWKITRHLEQKESGTKTSLTTAQFKALIKKRDAIRKASNSIEAEIKKKTKPYTISNLDIINHPKWNK
jgi:hypothetical protein